MNKWQVLFIILFLLYIILFIFNIIHPINIPYFYWINIFLWCAFLVFSMRKVLLIPKSNRKFRYYLFPFLIFLIVLLNILDIIRKY